MISSLCYDVPIPFHVGELPTYIPGKCAMLSFGAMKP